MIVFGYTEAVVVVVVARMIVVPVRTAQIIPGAAAKHFTGLSSIN